MQEGGRCDVFCSQNSYSDCFLFCKVGSKVKVESDDGRISDGILREEDKDL